MKRSIRSQKLEHSSAAATLVETTACINIMHGTLLSLYPRAAKRPTFSVRVALQRRLNDMLAAGANVQLEFITTHFNLMKLCFMEYTVNVLLDFMPCERDLLFCTPAMTLYQSVCPTSCDAFRTECLMTGLEPWKSMDYQVFSPFVFSVQSLQC